MRFPDGSYSHAFRHGSNDSWLELKSAASEDPERGRGVGIIQVLQIQDELEYVVSNLDYLHEPDLVLLRYRDHHRILKFFLILNVIFEVLLNSYLIDHKDYIVASLASTYRDVAYEKIERIFVVSTTLDIIVNTCMYYCAFKALSSHKVTVYNHFVWLLLASIFTRIIISYLNILNLLMFIMKIVVYLHARYVLSMLYTVLLRPMPAIASPQQPLIAR